MKILKDLSVLTGLASALLSGFVICYFAQIEGVSNEGKLVAISTLILVNVCFAIVGILNMGKLFSILSGVAFFVIFMGLIFGFWKEGGYAGWYYVLDPSGYFKTVSFSIILSVAQGVLLLLAGIFEKKKK